MIKTKLTADGVTVGDEIGSWTVFGPAFRRGDASSWSFVCECSCGDFHVVRAKDLSARKSSKCIKCEHAERDHNKTHGESNTRLYKIWQSLKDRCLNPNCKDYINYGGRGIGIFPDWLIFVNFRDWALSHGYQDHLKIDRFPNNESGNYEPSNCRWATQQEQNENQRTNKVVRAFGEEKKLIEWKKDPRCLVDERLLYSRIFVYGLDPEEAMTIPKGKLKRRKAC